MTRVNADTLSVSHAVLVSMYRGRTCIQSCCTGTDTCKKVLVAKTKVSAVSDTLVHSVLCRCIAAS